MPTAQSIEHTIAAGIDCEHLAVRGDGQHWEAVIVSAAFEGLTPEKIAALVVAYEPIWAIGTGRTATSADAQDVCAAIRGCVAEIAGSEAADEVRIQYGGSVKASNIAELIAQPDIDGALVGGASLDPDEFSHICKLGA